MKNQTEVHFKLWYSVLEVVVVVMTSSAEGIYILASWGLILNHVLIAEVFYNHLYLQSI